MDGMPRSLFIAGQVDGCALWRSYMPALVVPGASYAVASELSGGVPPGTDVVIVQRQSSPMAFIAAQQARLRGIRVIHDIDDDFWSIPPSNPQYFEVRSQLVWFDRCLNAADLITVSTAPLAQAVIRRGFGPVHVIENAIELELFTPTNPSPPGRKLVKIGWPAGSGHQGDQDLVWDELESLVSDFPNVRIEVGASVPVMKYPRWLASRDWDFMIAPLVDNDFNRSKSFLKFLEAGALRIPCLGSDLPEYRKFCAYGLEILICKTMQEWHDKLRCFAASENMRRKLGQKIYNRVRTCHQTSHLSLLWREAIRTACALPHAKVDTQELARVIEEETQSRNFQTKESQ